MYFPAVFFFIYPLLLVILGYSVINRILVKEYLPYIKQIEKEGE